jgi:hypothetical protein
MGEDGAFSQNDSENPTLEYSTRDSYPRNSQYIKE